MHAVAQHVDIFAQVELELRELHGGLLQERLCRDRIRTAAKQVAANRSYRVLFLWQCDQRLLHHGAERLLPVFHHPHLALCDGQRTA